MVIKERLGKNTVLVQYIQNETPKDAKTLSSYILLKELYKNLDISFVEKNDNRYIKYG